MADEHTVSGAEHTGPEPSETPQNPRPTPPSSEDPADDHGDTTARADTPGPLTAAEPTAELTTEPTVETAAERGAADTGSGELIRVAPAAPRVQKPEVKDAWVFGLAVVILAFTAISGVSIWAAASFDGGVPGVTGPADGHRDAPIIPTADRTRPPTGAETAAATGPETGQTPPVAPAPRGSEPGGQPQTGRDNARAPAVDWAAVPYPQDCAGSPFEVRDARPLAPGGTTYVVQVRCSAGSGTAPDALYTYTVAPAAPPVLARTLLADTENRLVDSFDIRDGRITAQLLGWSGPDVPRCCPDVEETRVLTP